MLYVSRYVGEDKYGVVDTEDGSESIVSTDVLIESVGKLHMEIRGCEIIGTSPFNSDSYVCKVIPYQPLETLSNLQVKTNLLHYVDIKVYKSYIANLRWHFEEPMRPVAVRLSDFGRICGDRFLCGNHLTSGQNLTLIFDDSIELCKYAFWRPAALESSRGLTFDIREVTNERVVEKIYRDWTYELGGRNRVWAIRDIPERKDRVLGRH